MIWTRFADDDKPPKGYVLVAAENGRILGRYSGHHVEPQEETGIAWFIDDCYYDGDDPPVSWLLVPPA